MSLSWVLSFCPNMFSLTLPMLCRDVSANRYGWSNLWGVSWLHPDLQLASGCFPFFSRCFIVCCFYLLDLIALECAIALGGVGASSSFVFCRCCFRLFQFRRTELRQTWEDSRLSCCVFLEQEVFLGILKKRHLCLVILCTYLIIPLCLLNVFFSRLVLVIWKKKILVYKCVKRGNHTAIKLGKLQHWFSCCKVFPTLNNGTSPGCIPSSWL